MASFPDYNFLATFTILLLLSLEFSGAQATIVESKDPVNYCPYFGNRAPSAQPNLQNCTWYRKKACCLPEELNTLLEEIEPLTGANRKCLQTFNYLMCYVCAPNQNAFYKAERLTVCREFCDKLYQNCGEAILKGNRISNAYRSGKDFCESRKFVVKGKAGNECFSYEHVESAGKLTKTNFLVLLLILVFGSLWI